MQMRSFGRLANAGSSVLRCYGIGAGVKPLSVEGVLRDVSQSSYAINAGRAGRDWL